jgi:hypothetical protein
LGNSVPIKENPVRDLPSFIFCLSYAKIKAVRVNADKRACKRFSCGGCDTHGFIYQRCDFGEKLSLRYGHFLTSSQPNERAIQLFIFDLSDSQNQGFSFVGSVQLNHGLLFSVLITLC